MSVPARSIRVLGRWQRRMLQIVGFAILGMSLVGTAGVMTPSSAAETNLFANPNFDSGLVGWTVGGGCTPATWLAPDSSRPGYLLSYYNYFTAYSGGAVWLNSCGDSDPWIAQTVNVSQGQKYQVSGFVRTGWSGGIDSLVFRSFRVCLDDCVGASDLAVSVPNAATGTWLPFSAEFTATSNSATVKFVGEVVADSDYLIDSVAITESTSSRAQVTDTAATCSSVFLTGDYASLDAVQYSTKRGAINQVNPGVFYYWASVTLPAGGGEVVSQSASDEWARWFSQAPGTQLFDTDCATVKNARVATVDGITSASGGGITAGTYYLAVKFSATSIVGSKPPSADPIYSFTSEAGAPEAQLALVRKGSSVAVATMDEGDGARPRNAHRPETPGRSGEAVPSDRLAPQTEVGATPSGLADASTREQRPAAPQSAHRETPAEGSSRGAGGQRVAGLSVR